MKIRQGFVSNSSSSSFLLYGTYIDKHELAEKLWKSCKIIDKDFKHLEDVEDDIHEFLWIAKEELKKLDLELDGDYNNDEKCLGAHPASIRNDETGEEFKDRIKNNIKDLLNIKSIECDWHEEAWYDG